MTVLSRDARAALDEAIQEARRGGLNSGQKKFS